MREKLLVLVGLFAITLCCAKTANALLTVIDQQQTNIVTTFSLGNSGNNTAQQGIIAGVEGKLMGFDLWFLPTPVTSIVDAFVNYGTPWQNDTSEFVTTFTLTPEDRGDWFYIDTSTAELYLNPGQSYTIGITPHSGQFAFVFMISWDPGSSYSDGSLYFNGLAYPPGRDMAFRTHMAVVPVPPSSLLCATGGVILLVGKRFLRGRVRATTIN